MGIKDKVRHELTAHLVARAQADEKITELRGALGGIEALEAELEAERRDQAERETPAEEPDPPLDGLQEIENALEQESTTGEPGFPIG